MELWIRSQDKMNLVKIKQISINYRDNRQIIANYIPEAYENAGEYYELLGTYKTKERALEVLDEIHSILQINAGFDIYSKLGGFSNGFNEKYNFVPVYEMPKE